jgi:hypothetical protein
MSIGDARDLFSESVDYLENLVKLEQKKSLIIAISSNNSIFNQNKILDERGYVNINTIVENWDQHFSTKRCVSYMKNEQKDTLNDTLKLSNNIFSAIEKTKEKHPSAKFTAQESTSSFLMKNIQFYFYGKKDFLSFSQYGETYSYTIGNKTYQKINFEKSEEEIINLFEDLYVSNRLDYALDTPDHHFQLFYRTLNIQKSKPMEEKLFKEFTKYYTPHKLEEILSRDNSSILKKVTFSDSFNDHFYLFYTNNIIFFIIDDTVISTKYDQKGELLDAMKENVVNQLLKTKDYEIDGFRKSMVSIVEVSEKMKNGEYVRVNNWYSYKNELSISTQKLSNPNMKLNHWAGLIHLSIGDKVINTFSLYEYEKAIEEIKKQLPVEISGFLLKRYNEFLEEITIKYLPKSS